LLAAAQRAGEIAIEDSETAALAYLKNRPHKNLASFSKTPHPALPPSPQSGEGFICPVSRAGAVAWAVCRRQLERFNKSRSHRKGLGNRIARQRLGLRQPPAAILPQHGHAKAAEGGRSPKPRGISPPISHPGYRFY
jgi:hypothetical protein